MAKKQAPADQAAPKAEESIATLNLELDPAPPAQPAATEPPAASAAPPATPEPSASAAAPAAPESAPAVGADDPSLLPSAVSLARARGYEVSDNATDEDFWSHLETLESDREKFSALEAEAAALRQRLASVESQQQQPASAPAPEAKPASTAAANGTATTAQPAPAADDLAIPERPAHDPFTVQVLQFAQANGKLTEGPGGIVTTDDPNIRPHAEAYNKLVHAQRAYDAEWTPHKVATRIYEQRIAKEREAIRQQVLDEVKGTLSQRDQQSYFQQFNEQNAKWLFSADRTQWSKVGLQFATEVDGLLQRGFSPDDAIKRAKAYVKAETGESPWDGEAAAQPQPKPAEKVVLFRNRLKNNGHADTLPTAPVTRPAAGAATRDLGGLSFNQAMDQHFSDLMAEKVADRM